MKKTTQDTEIFSVSIRTENGDIVVSAHLGSFDESDGVTGATLADAYGRACATLYSSYLDIVRESGLERQAMTEAMQSAMGRHFVSIRASAKAEAEEPVVPYN